MITLILLISLLNLALNIVAVWQRHQQLKAVRTGAQGAFREVEGEPA